MRLNAYTLWQGGSAMTEIMTEEGRSVWVPARPLSGTFEPFMWRLREAWAVLRGRRHTIEFPYQEPDQWPASTG